ncbi:nitroreductase family protein [Chloroflexota bacterium]
MDFFEVVRKRRSVRRFSDQSVDEQDLKVILEATSLAPSATSEQLWRFIVIQDREMKNGMRDMVDAMINRVLDTVADATRRQRIEGMRAYSTHFAGAPIAIAVLARFWTGGGYSSSPEDTAPRDLSLESVAMAVDHLILAATAKGYGSCFASAPAEFARQELEVMLGVQLPWFLVGVVSIGVAAEIAKEKQGRKPLEDICTFIG